jgi:hemerythrin superfamily protein
MNAIHLLEQQHEEVFALFKKALQAPQPEPQLAIFEKIADAIAVHAIIEEKIFYPAVLDQSTERILLEATEEHLGVKRFVADLLSLPATDEHFAAKLKVVRDLLEHHVEEERRAIFPKARKLLDRSQLEALGESMEARAIELQGTSPRKQVPSETREAATL